MNAALISGNMKDQVSTLDEIKELYKRAVEDKLAGEEELAALNAYIESIDVPWHVMAKIADSIAKAEKDSKAKKDKDKKLKDNVKAARTVKADSKPDEKDSTKQEGLTDEAQADAPADAEANTDTEADDDLSFLD